MRTTIVAPLAPLALLRLAAGLPAPLLWRVTGARAGMTKMTSDTRENFRDDRTRRQGCARGGQAAGRGRMRAQRGECQSNPVIMGARSVLKSYLVLIAVPVLSRYTRSSRYTTT